jgi:hypothetical protein
MRVMRFVALVIVVYAGLVYGRTFSGGCGGACTPSGREFALLVCLEVLVAALVVFFGTMLYQEPNRSAGRRLDFDSRMEHGDERVYITNVDRNPRDRRA